MGRPEKLSPEIEAKLVEGLDGGLTYITACARAGLSYRTFARYRVKGEKAKRGRFRRFWQAMTDAENRAKARLMLQWQAAGKDDWRAARSYLARRWADELGHLEPLRVNNGNGNKGPGSPDPGMHAERPIIQILSAIPRPERPSSPPLTLSERAALPGAPDQASAPEPVAAPTSSPPSEPRDVGI